MMSSSVSPITPKIDHIRERLAPRLELILVDSILASLGNGQSREWLEQHR